MKLKTHQFTLGDGWQPALELGMNSKNTLLLFFGSSKDDWVEKELEELQIKFPDSVLAGCSTAGEIFDDEMFDNSVSLAVIHLENSSIKQASVTLKNDTNSKQIGVELANELTQDDLKAVFVISDGLKVNGSHLVKGISDSLDKNVVITGGLAGDGGNFENTWVWNDNKLTDGVVTAIGFYGESFNVGHGSKGGWDLLGPDRKVTRSDDNILYELDDQPALELYKKYLGERADELPASGLLFPLSIRNSSPEGGDTVRTILAVDEELQSITFAGNIPEGSLVRLMRANFDHLIDGASEAASSVNLNRQHSGDLLSIAISCVGRRLVLGQRVEDELEVIKEEFPENCQQIGFYSYGEISPLASGSCDLHNQTMTLTLIWETL